MEPTHLAMAGMAEAAENLALLIGWGGGVAAAVASLIAVSKRSAAWAAIAGVLILGLALLFRPWHYLQPIPPGVADDPDAVDFFHAWRFFAIVWCFVSAAVVTAVVKVRRAAGTARRLTER